MPGTDPISLSGEMLDAAKSYLRIDNGVEDDVIRTVMAAAVRHAEAFVGQLLLRRTQSVRLSAGSGWQALPVAPVIGIVGVTGIPADGAAFALQPPAWEAAIDKRGNASIRIVRPGSAGRVEVDVDAGIAADWGGLPDNIRLGLLRLAAHFHAHRDAGDDTSPPMAALALLAPWKRMRLA